MIGYPYDYQVMRIETVRRARRASRKDDFGTDRTHLSVHVSHLCVWLGRSLVSFGERIEVQQRDMELHN